MGKNRWTGVYSAQYIGSADDIIAVPDTTGSHVSSVVYHSLQLSYGIKKKWDISAGVEKVLDNLRWILRERCYPMRSARSRAPASIAS